MSIQNTAIVIDDHPLVARGVAAFLQSHCAFNSVFTADNQAQLWQLVDINHPPMLIVLDFWLQSGVSLDLLSQIKQSLPSTIILVVSADDDIAVQHKVQLAGGHGFIHKQANTDVFIQAVSSLMRHQTWFKPSSYHHQPKELTITAIELGLTVRQGEVLGMIMQGLPNKRIANALAVSEQTIKEHISGILSRMGVKNRIEVITKLRGKRLE